MHQHRDVLAANAVIDAADRIALATSTGQPTPPIRTLIGDTDIETAYAVQQELIGRRIATGAVVVGRKIGLTSPAVQQQLGVDQPDFGVLFADMDVSAEEEVPSERLLQPKAEAEVALVASCGAITLMATTRCRVSSNARSTTPIPPRPTTCCTS